MGESAPSPPLFQQVMAVVVAYGACVANELPTHCQHYDCRLMARRKAVSSLRAASACIPGKT